MLLREKHPAPVPDDHNIGLAGARYGRQGVKRGNAKYL